MLNKQQAAAERIRVASVEAQRAKEAAAKAAAKAEEAVEKARLASELADRRSKSAAARKMLQRVAAALGYIDNPREDYYGRSLEIMRSSETLVRSIESHSFSGSKSALIQKVRSLQSDLEKDPDAYKQAPAAKMYLGKSVLILAMIH